MRRLAVWMVLLLPWPLLAAEVQRGKSEMEKVEIVKEDFHGWPNSYRLSNGLVEARVVTDIGPRIADFRHTGGTNVIYMRDSELGKSGEDHWVQRGGWRLWVAPERQDTTYDPDNTPCHAEILNPTTLRVIGPPQPVAGIQKQVEITLNPGEVRLRVVSHIKNVTSHELTYAAWSLPVLRPKGRAFVPMDVGASTAYDATRRYMLWSYTKMSDPRYSFGDRLIQVDHSKVEPAPPNQAGRRDDESKIGCDSAQGWAAYLVDGTLFFKRFAHAKNGRYPDGGATIEVYSSHEFLELENLGPLTTIAAGEEIVLPEDWWLFPNVKIPTTEPEALEVLRPFIEKTAW
ncbi:MAG: hypothetical protein HY270_02095 [Deltaproteobacteria bacterium]|nr:hypothetical protein [Deltaproteobacteria bacterium]